MNRIITLALVLINLISYNQNCLLDKPDLPEQLFFTYNKSFDSKLSSTFIQGINKDLEDFARNTSNQIAVVTVNNTCGYSNNQFATKFGDKLALGQAKEDNGIVFLIHYNEQTKTRDVYLAIGKGLEGAIPDITAKKIVDNIILTSFKKGDFQAGIYNGIGALKKASKGEFNSKIDPKKDYTSLVFFILIVLLFMYLSYKSMQRYGGRTISRRGAFDHRDSFPYGGTWGGGGGFGSPGSSGGGFGGSGGGSFGGGGAGGSW